MRVRAGLDFCDRHQNGGRGVQTGAISDCCILKGW